MVEWNQWLRNHMQSCQTCAQAFNAMNGAMCEIAFEKMRERWKREASRREEGNKDSQGCHI